ncbi:hypothetical protein ABS751_10335 [Bacillus subtilis]|nr:hypothetical protein [Bacillus subtilis]AYK68289.1 hypothetical protein D9C11_23515 [Bacillus subtilis subsp. subtilis]
MKKTYEVQVDITQRFTTAVKVTGEFKDSNDPRIDQAAKQEADGMSHDDWDYDETEFEITNVKEESNNSFLEIDPKNIWWPKNMRNHQAFIGINGFGKTFQMKGYLHTETDDFKVIFDPYNEYQEDIQILHDKGYLIADESFSEPSNIPFSVQLNKALETSLDRKKVLHIVTNESENGFDEAAIKAFFEKIEKETHNTDKKISIYIDAHTSIINSLTPGIYAAGRSGNCLVYIAVQNKDEIKNEILANFKRPIEKNNFVVAKVRGMTDDSL